MSESTVLFGDGSLIGIVTEPAGEAAGVGVLLLNAGYTHHVGPQRLHVQLARRLSELGCTALRFDYSGIGDSPARPGTGSFADRAVAEAREAMDWLQANRGIDRFALFGICWGADNAVRVCAADPRVIGVAAVDFYAVVSVRYFLRFYLPRALRPRSWGNVLRGHSAVFGLARRVAGAVWTRACGRAPSGESSSNSEDALLPVRPPQEVMAEIERLVARGVRMWFAYATVGGSYDQYAMHFRRPMRALEATGRVHVKVFADCDHIFTLLHSQEALGQWAEDWARGVCGRSWQRSW